MLSSKEVIPIEYRKYYRNVTVAVVNFHAEWGNKRANLEKIKRYIERAHKEKVDLILFPELALTGAEVESEIKMHRELAEPIPGPTTIEMAEFSRKFNMYIVWGMPEIDRNNGLYYNTAVIVGPEGLLGVYRKIHPWVPERWCSKGSDYPVFETKFGPIGIGICYDNYFFPEVARIYALKGVRLYLNPTAVPVIEGFGVHDFIVHQLLARAGENLFYVASADLVGKELTIKFAGYSLIAGPCHPKLSHIYAGPASMENEEMLIATLDLTDVHKARNTIPVFRDRRPETYIPLIQK
ncbi:MAG: carbon-nitrogen hydrolase family protein [Candidatus Bathyarchaeia archaeon]